MSLGIYLPTLSSDRRKVKFPASSGLYWEETSLESYVDIP